MTKAVPRGKKFDINIRAECSHPHVSEKTLTRLIQRILKDLGFKRAIVSLLLVGTRRMKILNQQYLKHAWSTDVLAFGQGKLTKAANVKRQTRLEQGFLGDIVLCVPTIEAQAEEYGHSFKEELDYCLCHGILHLLGHEDKTRAGHRNMHQKQKQILKRIQSER